jgi:hypothetical protein
VAVTQYVSRLRFTSECVLELPASPSCTLVLFGFNIRLDGSITSIVQFFTACVDLGLFNLPVGWRHVRVQIWHSAVNRECILVGLAEVRRCLPCQDQSASRGSGLSGAERKSAGLGIEARSHALCVHFRTASTVGKIKERKTSLICAGVNRLRRSSHHVRTEKKAALTYWMKRSTGTSESAFFNL